jgi:NFU1 iron-sulfur cluster scaffold homolog, mitochondrial
MQILCTRRLAAHKSFRVMPKIAEIEPTPNPNAMKFILREPLTWGITRSYDNIEEAKDDPLATQLFEIEHVTNVFYVDHWITVTQDGSGDWQELMRKLAVPIREAPAADEGSAEIAAQVATGASLENLSEADRARVDKINEILDEQVRPYLQGDGGDLYVLGLEGNRLTVHYQGACGSCPSSISGTLAGIESLVRQIEPDMEVVAV